MARANKLYSVACYVGLWRMSCVRGAAVPDVLEVLGPDHVVVSRCEPSLKRSQRLLQKKQKALMRLASER